MKKFQIKKTNKKISKEHLRSLLESFERDEKLNSILIIITMLNLIITGLIYVFMNFFILTVVMAGLVIVIIIISYSFTKSFTLRLKSEKDKKLKESLKFYLVKGIKKNDIKLEDSLNKLILTERHYKINRIKYVSYFIMVISMEFFILLLYGKILFLNNQLNLGISEVITNYLFELIVNLPLFFSLLLRSLMFKSIREIREIINEILYKQLTKFEEKIEKIMDLKIKDFKFYRRVLLKNLQNWSDLYLGSYFIGLRKILLISDYKNLFYSLGNEIYYYNLFFNLKFKIDESKQFNNILNDKKKENILDNPILNLINLNIKRLNKNIQSQIIEKNERRNKIKTAQTWFVIISVPLSIIFSLISLISFIGL